MISGGVSFNVPVTNASIWRTFWPWRITAGSQVMFVVSDAQGEGRSSAAFPSGSRDCDTQIVEADYCRTLMSRSLT